VRRSALIGLAVAIALTLVAVSSAAAAVVSTSSSSSGGFSVVSFGGTGALPVAQVSIPFTMRGEIAVTFHGDAASGCASRGLCGYSGTVVWHAPSQGTLSLLTYRHAGRLSVSAQLFGFPSSPVAETGNVTAASVSLAAVESGAPAIVSTCADAVGSVLTTSSPVTDGRVHFRLDDASPGLLRTRCAGPLDSDVLGLLPAPSLPLAAVRRGHANVAFSVSRAFAANGFAGTVQAALSLSLGRPGRASSLSTGAGQNHTRYRELEIGYRAALHGSLVERISGDADPLLCAPLGACGLSGTLTVAPDVTRPLTGSLDVYAPAARPERDLLTAAGLARGGDVTGVTAAGEIAWGSGGAVSADLTQGPTACVDSAPLQGGFISLSSRGGRLTALFVPTIASGDSNPTRCPGPQAGSFGEAAAGRVALSALSPHTAQIPITTATKLVDDGYTGQIEPQLTLTLTRTSVRKRTFTGLQNVFTG
jgi:hypothetical protein